MSLAEMIVEYDADISKLAAGVDKAIGKTHQVQDAVTASGEKASASIAKTGAKAEEASGGFKHMLERALAFASVDAGIATVGGALGLLKDQIGDVIGVTEKHQFVAAQTNQVLKSTHDISGETAVSLNDLADALSQTTDFSHDTVQGGENLLLTFTGIGKQVFPQATRAILDVSQAMGQDLKSSAIQVGKALGDPLTGMTALQRIGVTFSAGEKEQIKTMMAHNNLIGAQKVILHELSTEFGGSATAAASTFGGMMQRLKNTFEDVKIKIGTAIIPLLTQFGNWFMANGVPLLTNFATLLTTQLIPGFVHLVTIGQNVINFFKQNEIAMDGLKAILVGVSIIIGVSLVTAFIAWATAAWAAAAGTIAATWPLLVIAAVVAAVVFGIVMAYQHWGAIVKWLGNLWATVSGWIGERFSWLGGVAHVVTSAIGGFFSGLGDRIQLWLYAWRLAFSLAGAAFSQFGSWIQSGISAIGSAFSGLGSLISGVWDGIVGAIRSAINFIIGLIDNFIGGIDSIGIDIGPVHIHPNIPKIPALATGGYIASTGLALVHQGEQVVPAARASSSAPGGAGGVIHFHLYLDSRQIAQGVMPAVVNEVRLKLGVRK